MPRQRAARAHPVGSNAISARPWRHSVMFALRSADVRSTTWSAPRSRAMAALSSEEVTATTVAPSEAAIWMAMDPTPEDAAPTTTLSPPERRPRVTSARHAVRAAIGRAAASTKVRWFGLGWRFSAGTQTYSACVPEVGRPQDLVVFRRGRRAGPPMEGGADDDAVAHGEGRRRPSGVLTDLRNDPRSVRSEDRPLLTCAWRPRASWRRAC